ncbi:hypothetical protein FOA52_015956 [Chlamydomonas sp. UWO 241]|nr:hypothetical protein FOA52_015956 [Chlamydomonas sp. UWO 241]
MHTRGGRGCSMQAALSAASKQDTRPTGALSQSHSNILANYHSSGVTDGNDGDGEGDKDGSWQEGTTLNPSRGPSCGSTAGDVIYQSYASTTYYSNIAAAGAEPPAFDGSGRHHDADEARRCSASPTASTSAAHNHPQPLPAGSPLLTRLFSVQPELLADMLAAVRSGNVWSSVMEVPPGAMTGRGDSTSGSGGGGYVPSAAMALDAAQTSGLGSGSGTAAKADQSQQRSMVGNGRAHSHFVAGGASTAAGAGPVLAERSVRRRSDEFDELDELDELNGLEEEHGHDGDDGDEALVFSDCNADDGNDNGDPRVIVSAACNVSAAGGSNGLILVSSFDDHEVDDACGLRWAPSGCRHGGSGGSGDCNGSPVKGNSRLKSSLSNTRLSSLLRFTMSAADVARADSLSLPARRDYNAQIAGSAGGARAHTRSMDYQPISPYGRGGSHHRTRGRAPYVPPASPRTELPPARAATTMRMSVDAMSGPQLSCLGAVPHETSSSGEAPAGSRMSLLPDGGALSWDLPPLLQPGPQEQQAHEAQPQQQQPQQPQQQQQHPGNPEVGRGDVPTHDNQLAEAPPPPRCGAPPPARRAIVCSMPPTPPPSRDLRLASMQRSRSGRLPGDCASAVVVGAAVVTPAACALSKPDAAGHAAVDRSWRASRAMQMFRDARLAISNMSHISHGHAAARLVLGTVRLTPISVAGGHRSAAALPSTGSGPGEGHATQKHSPYSGELMVSDASSEIHCVTAVMCGAATATAPATAPSAASATDCTHTRTSFAERPRRSISLQHAPSERAGPQRPYTPAAPPTVSKLMRRSGAGNKDALDNLLAAALCVFNYSNFSNVGGQDDGDDGDAAKEEDREANAWQVPPICFHEVFVKPVTDPQTGRPVVLITQTDVTVQKHMEMSLEALARAQLNVLSQGFPRHIVEFFTSVQPADLNRQINMGNLARSHKQVTVLFMDIADFTSMSRDVPASAVLTLVNSLFTRFDAMCDVYGVQKVDTAGDSYIVSSGVCNVDEEGFVQVVDEGSLDPIECAHRIMAFAGAMLKAAKEVTTPHNGSSISIRIGIHTGDCVSGLVGTKLPKFTLFGDTMNTASRMESTGQLNRIQVSSTTKDMLDAGRPPLPRYAFEATTGVFVKGKGVMVTHLWTAPQQTRFAFGSK